MLKQKVPGTLIYWLQCFNVACLVPIKDVLIDSNWQKPGLYDIFIPNGECEGIRTKQVDETGWDVDY